MAQNPDTIIKVTLRDQSGENSNFGVRPATPEDMSSLSLGFTDLMTAIDTELTLGLFVKYNQNTALRLSNTAEGGGNREDKVLLTYEDDVTKNVYQAEVPCRLTSLATVGVGSDSVPPADWSSTKTAWDTYVRSIDGNATTLLDVEIVGRNL